MSGQVGSQVKMTVGAQLADRQRPHAVRRRRGRHGHRPCRLPRRRRRATPTAISAISAAASPATRSRAARSCPVTTDDMRAVFAADDSPHIEIGTVYPTDDIRGTLYVDPMLSKHFAVLGSTGTGKSTSVALILHRISQLSPEGHIVMIDPHGEYSAAFKGCGELFNVDNLAAALLADELRRALRGAADHRRRRAPARRRHPRQMPARRAHQGQADARGSARSRSIRRSPIC